jgi:hypothetical protein
MTDYAKSETSPQLIARTAGFLYLVIIVLGLMGEMVVRSGIVVPGDSGYAGAFGTEQLNALASFFLDLHSHGYDLGLLSFGLSCLLLGYLVYRSGYLPRFIGILLFAAGFTYLIGGYTRFLAPAHVQAVAPIYIVAVVAEVAMCLWLLIKGVKVSEWLAVAGGPGLEDSSRDRAAKLT